MTVRLYVLLLVVLLETWGRTASADVQRFAILVGNDEGHADEGKLRYAQTDAQKVHAVLRDLGGFEPANIVLLRNEGASTFRSTLIAVNDRIRATTSLPDTQALLFVYYSGHADASALHLGSTDMRLSELAQLVRGSAATFRLLVVDACRSGALTRVKGGHTVPPFALPQEPELREEGLAFLTASSANEDAQESDELGGSFFTHAFVSGLLGAADSDGDGKVVLEEAYRHAYDATLRATSRTLAGTQHATFSYDFKGQSALVLTRLGGAAGPRGRLRFPPGVGFLVMRDRADGAVVAELGQNDRGSRTVSLPPGRYFVRGRGKDVLFEGDVSLSDGATVDVQTDRLARLQYARLVRKGARTAAFAHGPELGFTLRSELPGSAGVCPGIVAGYRLELENVGLYVRGGACTSGFENESLRATTNEFDLSLGALHAWDLPWVTLALGVGAGGAFFSQTFEGSGLAPARSSLSPFVLVSAGATFDLGAGFYAGLDVNAETHFLNLQATSHSPTETAVAFAVRGGLVASKLF